MATTAATVVIDGTCDSRLQRVRDAFAENFAQPGEVGATVAVTVGGKLVVDLWAGYADAARTRPWTRGTIVNIASTTKGVTAICAHRLVDRGLLDTSTRRSRSIGRSSRSGEGGGSSAPPP